MQQRLWAAPGSAVSRGSQLQHRVLPRLFKFMLRVRGWFSLNIAWGNAKAAQHLFPFSPCLCRGCSLGSGVKSAQGQPEWKSLVKTKWRDSSIDSPSQLSSAVRGFLEVRADLESLLEENCRGIWG